MSRWHRAPEVLDAARRWRDRCFMEDGSILSEKRLWTLENLAYLERYIVNVVDTSDRTFSVKLEDQLSPAPVAAKQLAAELLWLLYLGVSEEAMKGGTKRSQIKKVWEWSGEPLPDASFELSALDRGFAHPGTAYNTRRDWEYRFAVQLMRDWKRLPDAERRRVISDPWAFGGWVDGHSYSAARQFRHFLLALLFPEDYERIAGDQHKRLIVKTFLERFGEDADQVDYKDRLAVDRMLYQLRVRLEAEHDADPLDYYLEPLRSMWRGAREPPEAPDSELPTEADEQWYRDRFGNARAWAVSAGEGARMWPDFEQEGVVAIGWDYLGDLNAYASREEIAAAIIEKEAPSSKPVNSSLACWQFANEMQPGDHVLVKKGRSEFLAHGVVTSEYRYDDTRPEYQHVRDVEWRRKGKWRVPRERAVTNKTLTDFTPYKPWLRMVMDLIYGNQEPRWESPVARDTRAHYGAERYTTADAMEEVFLDPETFSAILSALGRKKNVILEGAPGVGKTFVARRVAWALIGQRDSERVQMVQFHQSYAYEDFVQGWRPRESGGFELQNGVFYRFCQKAQQDPEHAYAFIIDEINRGNLSKVFGELMMLIESDKRGPDFAIPLTYARSLDEQFYVPENVYIPGMMNTADRSLAMVDYALRRRFSFIRLEPAFGNERFSDHLLREDVPDDLVERIVERMSELNRLIAADTNNLGPGFEIGHSFFIPTADEEERGGSWYERIVRYEIEPLLHEYWFDQPDRVAQQIARLLA